MARTRTEGVPATRERILDVALDLFVRRGYAETSLREIAAELGFSKAALYYHFESKQDILIALHRRVHELTDGVVPLLQEAPRGEDTWARLIDVVIGIVLHNRRLIEFQLRNQEAMQDLHTGPALEKHGPNNSDAEEFVRGLLEDTAVPAERRVRWLASLGAVGAVVFGSALLADVADEEMESILRDVVGGVLAHPGPR